MSFLHLVLIRLSAGWDKPDLTDPAAAAVLLVPAPFLQLLLSVLALSSVMTTFTDKNIPAK